LLGIVLFSAFTSVACTFVVYQEGGPEKKQASLCSDNAAGGKGWHSREIKNLKMKKVM
jgi:hypothetical protein